MRRKASVGQGRADVAHAAERCGRELRRVVLNAAEIEPQVTWGTSPEMVVAVDGWCRIPTKETDPVKRTG